MINDIGDRYDYNPNPLYFLKDRMSDILSSTALVLNILTYISY